MEETNNAIATPAELERQYRELAPLNIIRTETVLSRLPIHNLSKKGTIDIHIVHKDVAGKVDLLWKVSPSRDYGEPRALAYKLDTIVINRLLDEAGRPVPNMLRLGSLRELAQELDHGKDTAAVRKALLQNASAFITAKLTYKARDGRVRRLETGFSRYSVIFTGDPFPDGGAADAVYLVLNELYREVLNNAPFRPLDYDYLRKLPPGAQRFYEILSRKMFAALKFKHAAAKLVYSEYCTYSAQCRYYERQPMQCQMNAIHREHKEHGYIADVKYEATVDAENKPDWIMYYTPGPKARAEYNTFTRSGRMAEMSIDAAPDDIAIAGPTPAKARRGGPRRIPAADAAAEADVSPLLSAMVARGISTSCAKGILAANDHAFILDRLEWGDEQIRSGGIRNPGGFYIHLIEEKVQPPPNFETSHKLKLRDEAERERNQLALEQMRLEQEYAQYKEQAVETYIRERLTPEEFEKITQRKVAESRRQYALLPGTTIAGIAERLVRAEIAKSISVSSFEAFCESRRPILEA